MLRRSFVIDALINIVMLSAAGMIAGSSSQEMIPRRRPRQSYKMLGELTMTDIRSRSPPPNLSGYPKFRQTTEMDKAYCVSDSKVIRRGHVCDGKFHCKDLSDEYLCVLANHDTRGQFQDVMSSLVHKINETRALFPLYDALKKRNVHDIGPIFARLSKTGNAQDFIQGACIPGLRNTVTMNSEENVTPCEVCEPGEIACVDVSFNQSRKCVNKSQVCDGILNCPNGQDEKYCDMNRKGKSNRRRFIGSMRRHGFNRTQVIATCESLRVGINILMDAAKAKRELGKMMNEMPPFSGRRPPMPEISLSLLSSRSKSILQLPSSNISLTLQQICDYKMDCDGGIDEMLCPRRFYCQSGSPLFVNSSALANGIADCDDGSDEWAMRKKRKWTLASKDKMVKDWYVLATMWIVGISATVGNSLVIFKSLTALLKLNGIRPWVKIRIFVLSALYRIRFHSNQHRQKFYRSDSSEKWRQRHTLNGWKKSVRIWDSVFILNLAAADFLMGIYLVVLGSVSLSQTQNYWEFDTTWRTSMLCRSLGVVAVLSSQTSVFTLVGLTTLRLCTVIRPFGVALLRRIRLLLFVCVAIWTISTLIAIFPVLPGITYMYASEAWLPLPHVRPNVVNLTVANELLQKAIAFSNNATSTVFESGDILQWQEIIQISSTLIPAYSDWKFFGYYSAHSVCLPKLFVAVGEPAWEHTVAFLSLNFAAFLYICLAYIIIYRRSMKSRSIVRNPSELSITRSCTPRYSDKESSPHHEKSLPRCGNADVSNCAGEQSERIMNEHKTVNQPNKKCHTSNGRDAGSMQKMQFRIAMLVATDFLCWVPICVLGFLHLLGFNISNTAYTVSAIGLLPINSAVNPILYSDCVLAILKSLFRSRR